MSQTRSNNRLVLITLDEASLGRGTPDQEHERAIAIYDLIEVNHFAIPGREHGPYKLAISLIERKLCLDIRSEGDQPIIMHFLSLTPFKRVIKDYEMICESYYEAIRTVGNEVIHQGFNAWPIHLPFHGHRSDHGDEDLAERILG